MSRRNGPVRISTLDEPGVTPGEMARDVRTGLTSDPKDLSAWPKYFYDAEGSKLFEEITAQPEYYQTAAEFSILRDRSAEIVSRTGCRTLVELGSGSASKTRALLDAMFEATPHGRAVRYVPLDVSESALRESGERLLGEYPGLQIRGYIGDFDHSLEGLFRSCGEAECRLVIFLGGTIGNFTPDKRREFLGRVRDGVRPGDHVLVGVDLVKERATLERAYNDAAGVTARFNKNLLTVINERLGGEFKVERFRHEALYNEDESRIEMWLFSEVAQEVPVADLGACVSFERREGLRTEISAKFTRDSIVDTFEEARLQLSELYTDDRGFFGLALGKRED